MLIRFSLNVRCPGCLLADSPGIIQVSKIESGVIEMRYYQLQVGGELHLAVEDEPGILLDITSVQPRLRVLPDLLHTATVASFTIDELARRLISGAAPDRYGLEAVLKASRGEVFGPALAPPLQPPEVWCAGVTYYRSLEERRLESQTPDVYSLVYDAPRPELFLKTTASRVVGPFQAVGIRGDSTWNVPEPELAFVWYGGRIVGYTIGNDMSSRSIEAENPLYLTQAKVFQGCAAIGPCFVSAESLGDPQQLAVSLSIIRDGRELFSGETSTRQMKRTCVELADWLQRHNVLLDGTVVFTGTGIVPPAPFTLRPDDVIRITLEGIGTLENVVVTV